MAMVRWVSARWVIAVLGVGGLALAQEGLIVDPWMHPSAASRGEAAKTGVGHVAAAGSHLAPAPDDTAKARPRIAPVGPPLESRTNAGAVVPIGPASEGLVDPWANASPRSAEAEHHARLAFARHDWAWEVQEIVDPWAKGPVVAARDPLIVDPWAR